VAAHDDRKAPALGWSLPHQDANVSHEIESEPRRYVWTASRYGNATREWTE
jgi:hypothetical protein